MLNVLVQETSVTASPGPDSDTHAEVNRPWTSRRPRKAGGALRTVRGHVGTWSQTQVGPGSEAIADRGPPVCLLVHLLSLLLDPARAALSVLTGMFQKPLDWHRGEKAVSECRDCAPCRASGQAGALTFAPSRSGPRASCSPVSTQRPPCPPLHGPPALLRAPCPTLSLSHKIALSSWVSSETTRTVTQPEKATLEGNPWPRVRAEAAISKVRDA